MLTPANKKFDGTAFCVKIWGLLTLFLSFSAIVFVIIAGFYMDKEGKFISDTPIKIAITYNILRDNNTLIAGILGFSALAWAYSFQEWMKRREPAE